MKADVSQKSLLLDQSKKQLEELQSFNAKLQEELKTREEVSKQKKEKLKETLNQLEAKHVKCKC
jgi:predicted nuclease with TOPRIM domain